MNKSATAPGVFVIGAVLALLVAANPVSTDTLAPGVPALRDFFGVSTSGANLVFSTYVFAFGFMQLVYGPIADRFGRRPVLLIAMSLYCVATVLCASLQRSKPSVRASAAGGSRSRCSGSRSGSHPRFIRRGRFAEGNELCDVGFRNICHRSARYRGYPGCMEGLAGIFFFCAVYALVTIAAVFVYLKETRPESAPHPFNCPQCLRFTCA